mgnify:CR=1 FL=1
MPTRYLKPGICDSDSIDKCSPLAETLFYRLLVNVDDFGRLDCRPVLVKSKCFPLKEELTSKDIETLLAELVRNGLVIVYQQGERTFLQMQKWDNQPRSKESKCPALTDTCIRLYTDAGIPRTNLPVTVTVTVTETETGSGESKPRATAKPSEPAKAASPLNAATWKAYSMAYFDKYGTEPVRNAKVNAQVDQLGKRLGDDAPHVAGWFLTHTNGWYAQKMHSIDVLLSDAEKLRTEWATGTQMTQARARQVDKSSGSGNAFLRLAEGTK